MRGLALFTTAMKTLRSRPSGQRIASTPCQACGVREKTRLRFPSELARIGSGNSSKGGAERGEKRPPSSRITVSPPQPGSQSSAVLK